MKFLRESIRRYKGEYKQLLNYKTVGLVGLCPGAGTTQLAVMLANYCCNGLHLRVALVSEEQALDFDSIKNNYKVHKTRYYSGPGCRRGFSYMGIDFFSGVNDEILALIKNEYDTVIIILKLPNIKDNLSGRLAGIIECEKKILVGSFLPWKLEECKNRLKRLNRILCVQRLDMATMTYDKNVAKEFKKEYGIIPLVIPIERSPFSIEGCNLSFYRGLMHQNN